MEKINYGNVLRDVVAAGLSKVPRSLVRKLLAAEVRLKCSTALLRTDESPPELRAVGAQTGAHSSSVRECDIWLSILLLRAFCSAHAGSIELSRPVPKLHRCLLFQLVYFTKHAAPAEEPLARLALCYIDDCNQKDLQAIVNAVSLPFVRLEVSNCVTAEPRPWNKSQMAIVTFAAVLLVVIVVSTLADHSVGQQSPWRIKYGLMFHVAKAFSAKANTRILFHVANKDQVEQHSLQFVHGIRCLTAMHVVIGHVNLMVTDSVSGLLSLFVSTTKWQNMVIPAGFNGIDTFFFLCGFFLCHVLIKQKGNVAVVFIVAVVRRLIRVYVPLFFVIMWFYLVPRFVDGPDTETFFQRFYADMSKHWWTYLVQIRNFYEFDLQQIFIHPWFLSMDFQLFLVSLLTLLTFRWRKRLALAALATLSLLGCIISTWTMARLNLPPFLIMPAPDESRMLRTINHYYVKPFYHAVCYFSGCMTCLIVADFRKSKISKTLQLAGWCISVSFALFCVFVKLPWYLKGESHHERCRGGPVTKFLSWNAFVPFSRLSYGVFLIHLPLFELMMHSSRERVHFSEFNRATLIGGVLMWCFVFSYLAFIACEAPVAALDRLAFGRLTGRTSNRRQERQEEP
ncbi:hypothetical protein MTO96_019750 [Rhipicephalus appendiculatus]